MDHKRVPSLADKSPGMNMNLFRKIGWLYLQHSLSHLPMRMMTSYHNTRNLRYTCTSFRHL